MTVQREAVNLWKIRKSVMQMCHDRGYFVTEDELNQTLNQFKKEFGHKPRPGRPSNDDLMIIVDRKNNDKDRMVIFFPDEPVIEERTVRKYWRFMIDLEIRKAVMVVEGELTTPALQLMSDMEPNYTMEHFLDYELINLPDYELRPKLSVLTPQEKNAFFNEYNLKDHMLLKIMQSDPLARYYGLKSKQVNTLVCINGEVEGQYDLSNVLKNCSY